MSEFIPSGKPTQAEAALQMLRTFDEDWQAGRLPDSVNEQLRDALGDAAGNGKTYLAQQAPELEASIAEAEQISAGTRDYLSGPIDGVDIVDASRMLLEADAKAMDARAQLDDAEATWAHERVDLNLRYIEIKEQYVRDTLRIEDGSEADQALNVALQPVREELLTIEGEIDPALERDAALREQHHDALENRLAEVEADPDAANEQLHQRVHEAESRNEIQDAVNAVDHGDLPGEEIVAS